MGLDVYLYRHAQPLAELERLEAEAEEKFEAIDDAVLKEFGASSYEALPEPARDDYFARCRELHLAAGLDEFGGLAEGPDNCKISQPSVKHPEHYFKIGYFRSSYNFGGLNSVLARAGLAGLYDIFGPADRDRFIPDWRGSLARAVELRTSYSRGLEVSM